MDSSSSRHAMPCLGRGMGPGALRLELGLEGLAGFEEKRNL